VHNFIRGLDSVPGAWTELNDEKVKLYGSQLWDKPKPDGVTVEVKGADFEGIVHPEGLLIPCKDASMVCFVYFHIIQYFQIFQYKLSNIMKLN
jgi:formyltetrahydrofolate dehydrogenase